MNLKGKVLLLSFVLTLSPALQSRAQQQAQGIDGSVNPELIPNFYAWKTFFWAADEAYRKGSGFYSYFVLNQVGLRELISNNASLRSRVFRVLIEVASDAIREDQRLKSEMAQLLRRWRENPSYDPNDPLTQENIKLFKEMVSHMRHYRDSLRSQVEGLDPVFGPKLVERIDKAVERFKGNIGIARFGGDVALTDEILKEFDSKAKP